MERIRITSDKNGQDTFQVNIHADYKDLTLEEILALIHTSQKAVDVLYKILEAHHGPLPPDLKMALLSQKGAKALLDQILKNANLLKSVVTMPTAGLN